MHSLSAHGFFGRDRARTSRPLADDVFHAQERDKLKEKVQQLTDEVSDLSGQLSEVKRAHTDRCQEVEALKADAAQRSADAAAALAAMTAEHGARVEELQGERKAAAAAAEAAAQEHAGRETQLNGQLQSVSDELEELQSSTKRQAVAWRFQKAHLASDRDGYKGQVEALRDKVCSRRGIS